MNIFESISRATRRIEPFHSQFLADALQASVDGDRSLFNAVWRLTAPDDWDAPANAEVSTEEVMLEQGRIDITIKCESPKPRIVGIEVKTTDASATTGQLERYHGGLQRKYHHHEVAIAYLTPFNRKWAQGGADDLPDLPTVTEFEEFSKTHPTARHVSWLDIAAISWNGNELWRQHQLYVYQHISSRRRLRLPMIRNRSLDSFFCVESVLDFWENLLELGVETSEDGGATIGLAKFDRIPDFADRLVQSLHILITDDEVSRDASKDDEFRDDLKRPFLDSPYRKVHEALFALSERHSHVWVKGKMNYGVRVAHGKFPSGVSLITSADVDFLKIEGKR